jgi:hypothetical protein
MQVYPKAYANNLKIINSSSHKLFRTFWISLDRPLTTAILSSSKLRLLALASRSNPRSSCRTNSFCLRSRAMGLLMSHSRLWRNSLSKSNHLLLLQRSHSWTRQSFWRKQSRISFNLLLRQSPTSQHQQLKSRWKVNHHRSQRQRPKTVNQTTSCSKTLLITTLLSSIIKLCSSHRAVSSSKIMRLIIRTRSSGDERGV